MTAPKATILIVDDDEKNVKLLEAILKTEGYRCESAFSGREALEKVKLEQPDLILLDIMMPEIDGYEVCRVIKGSAETKNIPVIMVTALTDRQEKIKSLELGADDFISKPIDKIELIARIRSLLRIKRYQDELKENLIQLEEKNRKIQQLMKERKALVNMIVHDLRSPVTGIQGYLQVILMKEETLDDKRAQLIKKALLCCSELDLMISNILTLEKAEDTSVSLKKELCNIRELLEEAISIYQFKINAKGLNVEIEDDGFHKIYADANLIKRVIYNLLDNAVKKAIEQTSILIELRKKSDGQFLFSITNEGITINPDLREKIFEMFQQADRIPSFGSYGIGLAFCKMAIELHGGKIWMESCKEGRGCTFKFMIPA